MECTVKLKMGVSWRIRTKQKIPNLKSHSKVFWRKKIIHNTVILKLENCIRINHFLKAFEDYCTRYCTSAVMHTLPSVTFWGSKKKKILEIKPYLKQIATDNIFQSGVNSMYFFFLFLYNQRRGEDRRKKS